MLTRLAAIVSQSIDSRNWISMRLWYPICLRLRLRYSKVISVANIFFLFFFPIFVYGMWRWFPIRVGKFWSYSFFSRFSFLNTPDRYHSSISNRGWKWVSRVHDRNENRKFKRFEQEVRYNAFAEGGRYDGSVYAPRFRHFSNTNLEYVCWFVYN